LHYLTASAKVIYAGLLLTWTVQMKIYTSSVLMWTVCNYYFYKCYFLLPLIITVKPSHLPFVVNLEVQHSQNYTNYNVLPSSYQIIYIYLDIHYV
jgi:hypothetical protein